MFTRRTHASILAAVSLGALSSSLALETACELGTPTLDPGSVVSAAAGCPDLASVDAIARVDWAKEFGLDATAAAKLGAGLQAALTLDAFAARLDADLRSACAPIATDLGHDGELRDGKQACKAAAQGIGDVRSKLGANARVSLAVDPPRCSASMQGMADCVASCDANVEPGSVQVQCEPGKLAGTCGGECTGSCTLDAAAQCEGTCQGSCTASFEGTCDGACSGQCNGSAIDGAVCNGTCTGRCSAGAEGRCGGRCQGSCEISGAARCDGTCRGSCSVQMQSPRCEGAMNPPEASAECDARCEAHVGASVVCTPARVDLFVSGAADADAAARLAATLKRNLPGVLKVAIGMKDQALGVAAQGKAVAQGVQASVRTLQAAPQAGARLTACVGVPFQSAIAAAASIQASVDVSVEVHASASASASGSASGSAGASP
jgi:hypothetical protein